MFDRTLGSVVFVFLFYAVGMAIYPPSFVGFVVIAVPALATYALLRPAKWFATRVGAAAKSRELQAWERRFAELETPPTDLRNEAPQFGYLELAGRSVYVTRGFSALLFLAGSIYWISSGLLWVGVSLLTLAIIAMADGLATWLRVRMHLYCGGALEASEVAAFWRMDGRRPRNGPPGSAYEQEILVPELPGTVDAAGGAAA